MDFPSLVGHPTGYFAGLTYLGGIRRPEQPSSASGAVPLSSELIGIGDHLARLIPSVIAVDSDYRRDSIELHGLCNAWVSYCKSICGAIFLLCGLGERSPTDRERKKHFQRSFCGH